MVISWCGRCFTDERRIIKRNTIIIIHQSARIVKRQEAASSCKATTDRLGRGTPPHDQRGAVLLHCSILRRCLSSAGAPQRPRSGHRSRAVLIRPPGRVDGRAAHTGEICRHLTRFQRRRVTNWPLNRRKWPTRGAGEGLRTATDCHGLLRTGSAIRGAVARADLRPWPRGRPPCYTVSTHRGRGLQSGQFVQSAHLWPCRWCPPPSPPPSPPGILLGGS